MGLIDTCMTLTDPFGIQRGAANGAVNALKESPYGELIHAHARFGRRMGEKNLEIMNEIPLVGYLPTVWFSKKCIELNNKVNQGVENRFAPAGAQTQYASATDNYPSPGQLIL